MLSSKTILQVEITTLLLLTFLGECMARPMTFTYDVFLSHSSKDNLLCRELAERLKNDGLHVWFDEWEIKPGDLISLAVEKGLQNSRTLILAMSRNSFDSDWVSLE